MDFFCIFELTFSLKVMKSKITLLSIIFSFIGFSQTPINSFFNVDSGIVYDIVTSAAGIDQTTVGENVVWNFTDLSIIGQSLSLNTIPNATQITNFPTSNILNTVTTTIGAVNSESQIFAKKTAIEVSLTGFKTPDLELNYITNNAKIGTFPLNYGYDFTDNTAGTFVSGTNNGTFTGTIITKVDAYGILNLSNNGSGGGIETYSVTRIKTSQNINLVVGFLPVGTVVQTTYAYIDPTNEAQFRYTTAVANIPLLNIINQTVTRMENWAAGLLSTNNSLEIANKFQVYPNPANDFLIIKNNENLKINALVITDINGREIINQTNNFEKMNVNELQKGIYLLKIDSESGIFIKKIIKN